MVMPPFQIILFFLCLQEVGALETEDEGGDASTIIIILLVVFILVLSIGLFLQNRNFRILQKHLDESKVESKPVETIHVVKSEPKAKSVERST